MTAPTARPSAAALFGAVFGFELRYQLRSPLFIGVAATFFLLAFLGMASESVTIGDDDASLLLNSHYGIVLTHHVFSILAMFAAVAFAGTPMTRDAEFRTRELLMSTRVRPWPFVLGRFCASYLAALAATAVAILGTMLGTFMPWLDPERIGAFSATPYVHSLLSVMAPNLFIECALFFALATWWRTTMAAYLGTLGLLLFYVVVSAVTDQENIATMALFDPFGLTGFELAARYWTVFEKNTDLPSLAGALLLARIAWIVAAAALLLLVTARFDPRAAPSQRGSRMPGRARWPLARRAQEASSPEVLTHAAIAQPRAQHVPMPRRALAWAAFVSQVRIDLRFVFGSAPFLILTLMGIVNAVAGISATLSQYYGTPVHPLTGTIVEALGGTFSLSLLLILTYYAGELVHRERVHRLRDIVDASPAPSGALVASKVVTLMLVILAMLALAILTGVIIQLAHGYTRLQLDVYLLGFVYGFGVNFLLYAVVAVFLQVLTNNRFAGMLAFIVVFMGFQVLQGTGYEHVLYHIGVPTMPYSDMNGFGHFLWPQTVLLAYWSAFALLLAIASHLLWIRGLAGAPRTRLAQAARRFDGGTRTLALAGIAAFIGLGGFLYYQTNVVTTYLDRDELEARQVDYERRFARFEDAAQPDIVSVDVQVDLSPSDRKVRSRGTMQWRNDAGQPIDALYVNLPSALTIHRMYIPGVAKSEIDRRLGFHVYRLEKPLAPGETLRAAFDFSWEEPGFHFEHGNTSVVDNGTYFDSSSVLPYLGFDRSRILLDNAKRREHGMPAAKRMAKIDDANALRRSMFGVRTRTEFHAIVSTDADQVAVAPGYLERTWLAGERRYFEYRMDAPIWPFFSFSSARYAQRQAHWGDVPITVYYHPQHAENVDRMLQGSRDSLAYFSTAFAPYQYRQFRILEFPAYQKMAVSFPNTIPFSEGIGFVADLTDESRIDYVYYVTAHEAAHQWWGHQLAPANVQGQSMITESLAQYSALMVMEHRYGRAKMRRFLKYELDRYLRSRGGELLEEMPLSLVESQNYIHYNKGSLAMYALRDYLGEAAVNRALANFLRRWRADAPAVAGPVSAGLPLQDRRFPTTRDLIGAFREVTPPALQPLVTDLFEKIVIYDLRARSATARRLADGRFEITLTVEAHKFEDDGRGRSTEQPLDLVMDAAVFAASDNGGSDDLPPQLARERVRVHSGTQQVRLVTRALPVKAGIDPLNVLIDRAPDDNLVDVDLPTTATAAR